MSHTSREQLSAEAKTLLADLLNRQDSL